MRDMANLTTDGPRWIVLDGDIDPMWIESLNTVMDDNKVGRAARGEERKQWEVEGTVVLTLSCVLSYVLPRGLLCPFCPPRDVPALNMP